MQTEELVTVYTVSHAAEAEIIKNALESEGIRTLLTSYEAAVKKGLRSWPLEVWQNFVDQTVAILNNNLFMRLGWFFILGRTMMFSLSVDAVIYERFGSITQFVFSLPLLRIIPRRSAKLRKLFGLEKPDQTAA